MDNSDWLDEFHCWLEQFGSTNFIFAFANFVGRISTGIGQTVRGLVAGCAMPDPGAVSCSRSRRLALVGILRGILSATLAAARIPSSSGCGQGRSRRSAPLPPDLDGGRGLISRQRCTRMKSVGRAYAPDQLWRWSREAEIDGATETVAKILRDVAPVLPAYVSTAMPRGEGTVLDDADAHGPNLNGRSATRCLCRDSPQTRYSLRGDLIDGKGEPATGVGCASRGVCALGTWRGQGGGVVNSQAGVYDFGRKGVWVERSGEGSG